MKFHDGAIYDGPYIHEACLDLKGSVPPGEIASGVRRANEE